MPLFKEKCWQFFFFIGIFLVFFLPPLDTDLGWHLRYGQYFWQKGKVLTTNKFTLLLEGYSWPHSYTLYQIITFIVFKLCQFFSLSFFNSLIFLLSFYLIYLYFKKNLFKTVILFLIITPLSWHVFSLGWRAQIFSFLGVVFIFYLLKSGKKFLLLPLIFLFWVNLHGGFVLGLIILSIYLLLQLIKLIIKKNRFKKFFIIGLSFLLSLLATFFNPYKMKIWWEAWHHLKIPMKTLIAEWVPPPLIISFLIIVTFIFCLLLIFFEKKKNFWLAFLLTCLCLFFYLSLAARRNVPFFFLNASLIIFNSSFLNKWRKNLNFISLTKALIILIFTWGISFQLPKTILINTVWDNYCQARKSFPFPCQAIEFLKQNSIKGNFYNTYEWGGFLEWQLPESKFFVDGRMPAWPIPSEESPYTIYLKIIQVQPGWQERLEKYKINYLFIANGTFLDLKLKNNSQKYHWKEIYRDRKAVVYKKV